MLDKVLASTFSLPFLMGTSTESGSYSTYTLLDSTNGFWSFPDVEKNSIDSILVTLFSWLNLYDPQPIWQLIGVRAGIPVRAQLQIDKTSTFSSLVNTLSFDEVLPTPRSQFSPCCAIVFGNNDCFNFDYPWVVCVDLPAKVVTLNYAKNYFTDDQISYLVRHFHQLMSLIEPLAKIHDLPLKVIDEEFLLHDYNASSQSLPIKSISEYIQDGARKHPEKITLTYQSIAVTSIELERRTAVISTALQRCLRNGVVGVYIPRSHLSVIALLGIWRAGLTYLPLPVDYPQLQLQHICAENDVKTVLVSNEIPLPVGFSDVETINIDRLQDEGVLPDQRNDLDAVGAVMYTSGSTGMPKGVKHTMRSLLNRFGWWREAYPVAESDVLGQRTAISFIPSLWEMVSGVVNGCSLAVLSDTEAKTPELLVAKLQEQKITRITLLPSFLTLMLKNDNVFLAKCPSLRYLVLAGETVTVQLLAAIHRQRPDLLVINDYGTTEVNGVLSCDSTSFLSSDGLPAGRPIANCQAYILDEKQQLMPCGVKGELYIGGIAASSAYVNLPEENRKKYCDIYFGGKQLRRLFRTNDIAMRYPNGIIRVLGRCDNVVKVRGIRVELEAVEQAILQYDNIREVAASTEKSEDGVTRLIAFVVRTDDQKELRGTDIVRALKGVVAEALLPARIDVVDSLPKTSNGKINRKAIKELRINHSLMQQSQQSPVLKFNSSLPEQKPLEADAFSADREFSAVSLELILQTLSEIGGVAYNQLSATDEFSCQGIDSASAVSFIDSLSHVIGRKIPVTLLYEHATPRALFNYLNQTTATATGAPPRVRAVRSKVAIVGIACRMPGAKTAEEFWRNLMTGRDTVGEIPAERWDWREFYSTDPSIAGKSNSRWGGFVDDIDQFDARFFNISGVEAKYMAPEQRVLLQTCWHAIEDAGYAEHDFYGRSVGVFMGARPADYSERIQQAGIQPDATTLLGNDNAILAARIAYYMNLKGPVITVDTACSSSAVAIHMACESISRGESDVVLAGGVSLVTTPTQYIVNTKAGMLSSDGRCKTFDQSANGFVQGEGCGVVVLKSLDQALTDQDRIYAVIEATGVNQDGKTNGITAPNGDAQKKLLASLYDGDRLNAADLAFIEAHGTGTKLGDPIEFDALTDVVGRQVLSRRTCALGSVKTNIGHLISAAGVASLIKVALSLHNKKIPPSLHFNTPNEHIDFDNTPFFVNTQLRDLPSDTRRRLAGLSSFGFSGTNCHMVLGTAPERTEKTFQSFPGEPVFIVLSAKDEAGLRRNAISLRSWLEGNTEINLHHLSYTLARRANQFDYLLVCTAQSFDLILDSLSAFIDATASPYIFKAQTQQLTHYRNRHFSCLAEQLVEQLSRSENTFDQEAINSLGVLVVNGAQVDIRSLFDSTRCELLSVPGFSFETERFWVGNKGGTADKNYPLSASTFTRIDAVKGGYTLALRSDNAGKPQWIYNIACARRDYQGHVIDDEIWWPATAQIDALKNVTCHLGIERSLQITQWELGAPCVLSADITAVKLTITELKPNEWRFEFSLDEKPFSSGFIIARGYRNASPVMELTTLRHQCRIEGDVDQFYTGMAERGICYGPGYRRISRIFSGHNQVLTKVILPVTPGVLASDYHVELLDAALHSAAVCLETESRQVPRAVRKLVLLGDIPAEFAVYIQLVNVDATHVEADIWMFDKYGTVFCWINRLQLQTVIKNKNYQDNSQMSLGSLKPLLYVPRWFDAPIRMSKANQSVAWIGSGGYAKDLSQVVTIYSTYPQAIEGFQHPGMNIEKVAWAIDCEKSLSLTDYCWQLIDFVAQLSSLQTQVKNIVVLCEHGDTWSKLALSLSGTIASLEREYPHIKIKLVHGMNMDRKTIEAETLDEGGYPEVHRVGASRVAPVWNEYRAKSIVSKNNFPEVSLITGGLGGIGRALAQQLAERAGNGVVLVGRRTISEADQAWIRSLRKNGAEVVYLQADVSLLSHCKRVMRQIKMRFNQLDNIYHCAGITRDALAFNKNRLQVAEVIAAKVDSCENIDIASRELTLKKFVLFSSISAVLGTAGQTDYGAANAYLDVFARKRNQNPHSSGHTISINWPLWDVKGMRPDANGEKWLRDAVGLHAMPPTIGVDVIEQLIADSLDQVMVLYGDEKRLKKFVEKSLSVDVQQAQASA